VPTGSDQCTITVTPPDYPTLSGAKATLTPKVSGTNFTSSTGSSATLNVTATKNATVGKSAQSTNVGTGATDQFVLTFNC
ncbi:hypothetical protein SB775_33250, partial [Peribacillus sp. SIMBA_075]|uniref:hypothetical protein n=1 Tax=Peribacillus sp. SIMBA_075 TaxID=3085813 RepID=UPI003978AF00